MKKIVAVVAVLVIGFTCFAQTQNNNSLLWRITNARNENVSYLFGTIHVPQKKFMTFSDSVYAAIQSVDVFYNEVDLLNQSMFGNSEMMDFFLEKGKQFDSIQKTNGWKNLVNRINKKYGEQLDPDNLMEFVSFSQKLLADAYGADEGVTIPDMMLARHASMLGKKTAGIETLLFQYKMIYQVLDARLEDTTMELEDETNLVNQMKEFYVAENVDSIGSITYNINPGYRKIVFDNRNISMADSIEKYVLMHPSFFAIGVGHLGSEVGVIALLRKKGFTVTPVHSKNKMSILVVNNMMEMLEQKNEAKEAVKDQDVKIDIEDLPPPPPPKVPPPKVKMEPAPKSKTKGKQQ